MDTENKNLPDERADMSRLPEEFGGPAAAGDDPAAPAPTPARSLFEPAALSSKLLPEDLPYAAEVEAALARRPDRRARC